MRISGPAVLLGLLAALVAAGLVVLALVGGDEEPPTAPGPPTAPTPPTASIFTTPTRVPDLTRLSVPKDGLVEPGYGLVIGNPRTGGGEVWLIPEGHDPVAISPSGRYFVWRQEVIDGWTGQQFAVGSGYDIIQGGSFAPDDSMVYVQTAKLEGRLFRLDGTLVAELAQMDTPPGVSYPADVVWTADSRAVAITRNNGGQANTSVFIDGAPGELRAPAGHAIWSNTGLMLAVAQVESTTIIDYETGKTREFPVGGSYPAWSGDDRYLALDITRHANGAAERALTVLDTTAGVEVLRVYGASACLDLSWRGNVLEAGYTGYMVRVPEGELLQPTAVDATPPRLPAVRGDGTGMMEWLGASGVFARVRIESSFAVSFSWVRRDIDGYPPVLFLGRGGKDLCLTSDVPVVVFPPFTQDRIPTPTPTRTH